MANIQEDETMNELQRLQFLDFSVHQATRDGLTALATKHFIDLQFYGLPKKEQFEVFKNNPANTILYQANSSLIDGSVMNLHEHIKSEDQRGALPFVIPDQKNLRRHRVILSHAGRIFFQEKEIQQFFDDREHYKEQKTALRFWRTRAALLTKYAEMGGEVKFPLAVTPQLGTLETIGSVKRFV